MTLKRHIIAVDFDGVLHHYNKYERRANGNPIPGSLTAIHAMRADGWQVIVFTARPVASARRWLRDHGFPRLPITQKKPKQAVVMFDDRARHVPTNTRNGLMRAYTAWHREGTSHEHFL